jgi:hypothetical protein
MCGHTTGRVAIDVAANRDTAYVRARAGGIIGFIREDPLVRRWLVSFARKAAAVRDLVSAGVRPVLRLVA